MLVFVQQMSIYQMATFFLLVALIATTQEKSLKAQNKLTYITGKTKPGLLLVRFMQAAWSNPNNFVQVNVGTDPIIGQAAPDARNQK